MQNGEGYKSQIAVFFSKKAVLATIAIDIFLVLGAILFRSYSETKDETYLELMITPTDSIITIDNQPNEYGNGIYRMPPGEHHVTVAKDGLQEKSFDISLDAKSYTIIAAFLVGSDNNMDYYIARGNRNSFFKLKQIIEATNKNSETENEIAANFIKKYTEAYDGLGKLPLENNTYRESSDNGWTREKEKSIYIRIGDDTECKTDYCLTAILGGSAIEQDALSLLNENGLKTEAYEIIYKKF